MFRIINSSILVFSLLDDQQMGVRIHLRVTSYRDKEGSMPHIEFVCLFLSFTLLLSTTFTIWPRSYRTIVASHVDGPLDKQKRCCCSSHVKLIYGAHNRGVWSIFSGFILKGRPNEGPNIGVKTLKYLANHTEIPVPKVLHDWVDREGRYFTLEERIDGQALEEV